MNNNVSITLDTTICENELPYFWNNITFNSTGTETITLQSSTGCDSVITMNLLVYPSPELPMLDLNNSYCLYETPEPIILPNNLDNITWYTDNNLTEILSTQNQYTPEVLLGTNAYYVTASENGCEGSAQIILIEFISLSDYHFLRPLPLMVTNLMINGCSEILTIYTPRMWSVYITDGEINSSNLEKEYTVQILGMELITTKNYQSHHTIISSSLTMGKQHQSMGW